MTMSNATKNARKAELPKRANQIHHFVMCPTLLEDDARRISGLVGLR